MRDNTNKIFHTHGGWFLPFLLAVNVLFACSGGVKEGGNLGWTIGVTSGSGQTVLPRRPFKDPIEVLLKDSNGNPVPEALVEFRLVEGTLLGSDVPTDGDLDKAWNNPAAEMTSSDAPTRTKAIAAANESRSSGTNTLDTIEERVGRIDQADSSTDAQGRARAWIIAPSLFEKTIALIAKVGNSGDFDAAYSYALLNTSDVRSGAKLTLSTTNKNVEMAGDEFDIWLTVEDNDGRPAASINGRKKLTFTASPKNSWAGFTARFPVGDFDCEFASGRCLVPRGPYLLRVPGDMPVRVTVQDNTISAMETTIVVKSDGVKAHLALKNLPGPPTPITEQIQQLSRSPGSSIDLYAAWIDANGNYLTDATTGTWTITSSRLALGMSSFSGPNVTFAPTQTGTGILNVTSENSQLLSPVPVVVPANEAKSWRFRINNTDLPRDENFKEIPPLIKAGECLEIDVYAADAYGNVVPTIKGEIPLTLKIENASSGVVLERDSTWQTGTSIIVDRKTFFFEGVAKSVQTACFRDGTFTEGAPVPQITASAVNPISSGILTGTLPIRVQKNVPRKIVLLRGGNLETGVFDNSINVCTRFTQRQGGQNPCLVLTAEEQEYFLAAAVDEEGNFIKYVDVILEQGNGNFLNIENHYLVQDGQKLIPPSAPVTARTASHVQRHSLTPTTAPRTSTSITLTLTVKYKTDSGTLSTEELRTIDSAFLNGLSYDYKIVSKEPVELKSILRDATTNEELTTVEAGRRFRISAQMLDADKSPVLLQKKRVTTWHPSQDYDLAAEFKPSVSNVKAALSSSLRPLNNSEVQCHLLRANNPRDSLLNPQPVDNYEQDFDVTQRIPSISAGEIVLGDAVSFVLYRATNASNGGCSVNLAMEATVFENNENWTKTLSTASANPVQVRFADAVTSMRLRTADYNAGDDANPKNCNLNDVNDFRRTSENDSCHDNEPLTESSGRALYATFYDDFGNYLLAENKAVNFTWTNTPSLTSASLYNSLAAYTPSETLNYGIQNVGTIDGTALQIAYNQPVASGMSLGGAGFVVASYTENNRTLRATSEIFNFPSDVATSFVVDFIELNPANTKQPEIYWSSADDATTRPPARELEVGTEFAIRIRPVNANKTPVKGYLQLQKLRLSIPEPHTWARTGLKTPLAAELGTGLGGTNTLDVDCFFSVPVGLYDGPSVTLGAYTLSGAYDAGSECIVKKSDGSKRAFQLLSTSSPYDVSILDLNDQSTILNKRVIFQVHPVLGTGTGRALVAANKCGGPNATSPSSLWWESQANIPFSSRNNQVTKIGSGATEAYQITADESLVFIPALVDSFGNYVENIASVELQETKSPAFASNIITTSNESATCKKFEFEAQTANDSEAQAHILTIGTTVNSGLLLSLNIPIRIKHGNPAKLNVQFVNARFSGSTAEAPPPVNGSGVTEVRAGTCLSPSIRVMDSNSNLVKSFTQNVSVNLALSNYYSTSNLAEKELIHPGGLYRYRTATSVFTPITSLDSHTEADTIKDEGVDWLIAEKHRNPSVLDAGSLAIDYFSSEKSLRSAEAGKLDLLDRYICLMDASQGLAPNLRSAVTFIDTSNESKVILGESHPQQNIQVIAGNEVTADFRLVTGDETTPANERLCYIANSDFAVIKYINLVPILDVQSTRVCRKLNVSNAPIKLKGYLTDKVGNVVDSNSSATIGWAVKAPVGTTVCTTPAVASDTPVVCSLSTLTVGNMTKTGALDITWSSSARASNESFLVAIKSGPPQNFSISSNLQTITTDDDFGLRITLKDAYDNDYDPPTNFIYSPVTSIEYTGAFEPASGTNPPNGDSSITVKKPTEATLLFLDSNTASTSSIFGLRKANNSAPAGIKITFAPNPASQTPSSAEKPITIVAGQPFQNKMYFSNPYEPLVPTSSASNENILASTNNDKLLEVRSEDRAGNIAANPAVLFSYVENNSNLNPIVAHNSLPNSAWLPLSKAGEVIVEAALSQNQTVKTPQYKIVIRSSTATKVRLVRIGINGETLTDQNEPLVAGSEINFRVEVTDDQGNIFDQFNKAGYDLTWSVGNYPDRAEGPEAQLPGCSEADPNNCPEVVSVQQACNFVSGLCKNTAGTDNQSFNAVLFGSTGVGSVIQVKAEKAGESTLLGTHPVIVNPASFHHFGVKPSKTNVNALANKDSTDSNAKFSVTVEARDSYGNKVGTSGTENWRSVPIVLKIYQDNGITLANGSGSVHGQPTTPPTFGNSNSIVIGLTASSPTLAYDAAGNFRVFAEGLTDVASPTGNKGKGSNAAAPLIQFNAVLGTVAQYQLVFGSGLTEYVAGRETTLRLEAVDTYGNPVRGIDNVLSSHTYAWNGLSSSGTSNGQVRPADSLPTQFNSETTGKFTDGVALFKGTFFSARDYFVSTASSGNLSLTNTFNTPSDTSDDRAVVLTSKSMSQPITTIRVVQAPLFAYNIIATENTASNASSLASNTQIDAANTANGRFRLVVQPIDEYGNLRAGENGIKFVVIKSSSSAHTSSVVRRNGDTSFPEKFLDLSTGMRANVGFEFNDLYYRVPQPATLSISGTGNGIAVRDTVSLDFQVRPETIEKYELSISGSSGTANLTAGAETNVQLQAKDEAGNNLSGSAIAGDRAFQMTGPSPASDATSTYLPEFVDASISATPPLAGHLRFNSDGIATAKVKLYKAEILGSSIFALNDTTVSRSGKNTASWTVIPATVNEIKPETITPKVAGASWAVSAWAYDPYGNPSNNGCAVSASTGTPYLVLNGVDEAGVANELVSSGDGGGTATAAFSLMSETRLSQGATTGFFQLNNFKLFRKGENRLRFSGCSKIFSLTVSVLETDKANSLRLNSSVTPPSESWVSLANAECLPTETTGSALSCPKIYAFMWDEYGNSWQQSDCTWNYVSLVPASPLSVAGTLSGIETGSFERAISSDGYLNGALRCTLSSTRTKSGTALYQFVNLYGGIVGLGHRTTVDGEQQLNSGLQSDPADVSTLVAGENNLKISSLTLLQYRGGSVSSSGAVTAGTLQAVNRSRTEMYSFTSSPNTGYPSLLLPTNLSINHTAAGDAVQNADTNSFYSFSLTEPWSGSITVSTRGVSATLSSVTVNAGNANQIRIGKFTVGGAEKTTFLAGEEVTLESIEVTDSAGNSVCTGANSGAATIESPQVVMVPPVCGSDLSCTSSNISPTAVGSVPTDFSTFALNETGNKKTFSAGTTSGYWSNLKFKLYRSSLPFTLRVSACGKSIDTTVSVTSATATTHSRLSTDSRPAAAQTLVRPDVKCPLSGNGLAVSCPQINAYFWDTFGNEISSETCGTWNVATAAGSTAHTFGSLSGQMPLPLGNTASASISTTNSKYLSGLLTCSRGGVTSEAFVYGGLTSIQTSFKFGGVTGANSAQAAANNLEITALNAQFKKPSIDAANNNTLIETSIAKDDFNSSVSEVLTFSTDVGTLTDPALPIVTSTSFTCNFPSDGSCPTASLPKLSFRKVEGEREIRISLRGLTTTLSSEPSNITKFVATPARADTTKTTFDLLDSSNASKADSNFTADQTFGMNVTAKDAFGNSTNRNKDTGEICNSVEISQNTGNNALGNSAFTSPTTDPQFPTQLRSMQITKSGNHNVTFSVCGVNKTITFNISSGAAKSFYLSTISANAPTFLTCSIESGGGTTCDTVYANFRDDFGNPRSGDTCESWTLSAHGPPEQEAPTTVPWLTAASSASVSVSHLRNLDATLKCNKSGATQSGSLNGVKLYGGLSHLKVTASFVNKDTSTGFIPAASENVQISKIEARVYKDGTASNAAGVSGSEVISFATDAAAAPNGTTFTSTTAPSCEFTAGVCTPPNAFAFTFAKADTAAKKLTLSVRGVNSLSEGSNADLESIKVKAASPHSLEISSTGNKTAGSEFSITIEGRDSFRNPTLAGCTGVTMSGGSVSADGREPSFNWTTSGFNGNTSSSFHGSKATLYSAGPQTLLFSAAGCANVSGTLGLVVAPEVEKYALLTTVDAATVSTVPAWTLASVTSNTDIACQTLNTTNTGVTCPTLYVYKYDEYGNKTATTNSDIGNQKCLWQSKVHGAAEFSSWPAVGSSTEVHSAVRASNESAPAIDELVQCSGTGLTSNQVRLYGGPALLELETSQASTKSGNVYIIAGSSINAGTGNIVISKLALRSFKAGESVPMPFSATTSQEISFSIPATNGLVSNTFGSYPSSSLSSDVFNNSRNCTFNTNGACFSDTSMNFKRVETAGKKFTVSVRGVSVDVQLPEIKALAGSSLSVTFTDANNATLPLTGFNIDNYSANNSVKANVLMKDMFTNTTSIPPIGQSSCTGLEITGNTLGAFADSITAFNTDNSASTGTLKLYKATTHTLTFSKCHLTAYADLTIEKGATRRTLITTSNSEPASFNCLPNSNSIEDASTCTTSVTCAASDSGTLAGGTKCGTFYAWEYDKAGNRSTNGTSCTTTSSRSFLSTGGTTASSTSSFATVAGGGFTITASESSKHLEGNLTCVPAHPSGSLGGSEISLLAPVTVPIDVECTPWIYIGDGRDVNGISGANASVPLSLCSFVNGTAFSISNLTLENLSYSMAVSEAAPQLNLWKSWSGNSLTAGRMGQFLLQGSKGKHSGKFRVAGDSDDGVATRVVLGLPSALRVPLRTSTSASVSLLGQNPAASAGADLNLAEVAEIDSVLADVPYSGTTIQRRATIAVQGTTTAAPGAATSFSFSGNIFPSWIDNGTHYESPAIPIDTFGLDGSNTPFVFSNSTANNPRIWDKAQSFLFVGDTASTCVGNKTERIAGVCNVFLKHSPNSEVQGLRGVFMLLDANGYFTYHLTEPIP